MNLLSIGREIKRSFDTAYPNPFWPIILVSLVILSSPFLWIFGFRTNPPTEKDSLYFLLGTLPETLGTIFVLAFTLTFVAAQIASNYSRVLFHRVLGPWVLWYAIPFAIGILLPLFLLKGNFFLWSVHISLLIGAYCIASLLPFAVAVRGLLSISNAILDETKRILVASSSSDAQPFIADIVNISMGALGLRDYQTFDYGVKQLVVTATSCQIEDSRLLICKEIRTMIMRSSTEPYASEVLLNAIAEVGLNQWSSIDHQTKIQLADEVLSVYLSVDIAALWDRSSDIKLMGQQAISAIDQCQTEDVRKLQALLNAVAERTVLGFPVESTSSRSAFQTLGDLIQKELESSLPDNERGGLVMSTVTLVEYLGIKAKAAEKTDLASLAQTQLRRAASTASLRSPDVVKNISAAISSIQNS